MSWDAFSQSMLLLILASFVIERSLAVIFETRGYIQRFGMNKHLKPMIAIVYGMVFLAVFDINVAEVIRQSGTVESPSVGYVWSSGPSGITRNLLIIMISGIFIAGGSKASLKLFRDVWGIRSKDEEMRTQEIKTAPADPVQAASAAAKGNSEAEAMLYNLFDAADVGKARPGN